MGVVRSSDLAVASSAAIVPWLLVRTSLRGGVALSVACVAVTYFVALWARVRRASNDDVALPLYPFAVALCLARAWEFAWDLPRERAMVVVGLCALSSAGALLARARPRGGAAVAATAMAAGAWAGELRVAAAMLFVLWIPRAFARVWVACERAPWARVARWSAAVIAALWAWRGATVGPVGLMVGASTVAGGVIDSASDARSSAWDLAVFVAAAGAVGLTRAWEACPLLFV